MAPIDASGVARTDREGDTAVVGSEALEARVTGRWTSGAGQRVDVIYRNRGDRSLTVDAGALGLVHGTRAAKVEIASDATRERLASGAVDYAHVMPLLRADVVSTAARAAARPVLTIPAGAVRKMVVDFMPFAAGAQLREGDEITVAVPVPGGAVRLRFACRS